MTQILRMRRVVTWAMLALYGLIVSGIPLPLAAPSADSPAAKAILRKDQSRPFPCMDRACGCDSAERCFTSCCCHTTAELLAWANRKGIESSVMEVLMRRVATAPSPSSADACSKASQASVCHEPDEDDIDNAICSDYQSLAAEPRQHRSEGASFDEPVPASADNDPVGDVIVLRDVLACGGVVAQWAAVSVSLPPPDLVTCELSAPQAGSLALANERACVVNGPPDLPPPRC